MTTSVSTSATALSGAKPQVANNDNNPNANIMLATTKVPVPLEIHNEAIEQMEQIGPDDFDESDGESRDKRSGRRKIRIEYIEDKSRRHITFSKRKAGIMKKAYELSTLTGTQVLLLVASETGHVYTFATPKLQPLITKQEGKNLIQACLNAPDQLTDLSGVSDSPRGYPVSGHHRDSMASLHSDIAAHHLGAVDHSQYRTSDDMKTAANMAASMAAANAAYASMAAQSPYSGASYLAPGPGNPAGVSTSMAAYPQYHASSYAPQHSMAAGGASSAYLHPGYWTAAGVSSTASPGPQPMGASGSRGSLSTPPVMSGSNSSLNMMMSSGSNSASNLQG
jgi:hypothetical protein